MAIGCNADRWLGWGCLQGPPAGSPQACEGPARGADECGERSAHAEPGSQVPTSWDLASSRPEGPSPPPRLGLAS